LGGFDRLDHQTSIKAGRTMAELAKVLLSGFLPWLGGLVYLIVAVAGLIGIARAWGAQIPGRGDAAGGGDGTPGR